MKTDFIFSKNYQVSIALQLGIGKGGYEIPPPYWNVNWVDFVQVFSSCCEMMSALAVGFRTVLILMTPSCYSLSVPLSLWSLGIEGLEFIFNNSSYIVR